jgi:hypothetical protein
MILEKMSSSSRSCAFKSICCVVFRRVRMTEEGEFKIWFDDENAVT